MEIHTNDKKPRADRPNVDLSKKVTRETPSAHRSIRTVSTVISPRKNNGDTIIQNTRNTRNAVKKTTGAIEKTANAVSRTTNAVEDVIVNAADSSTMGGAAIKQGIKTAQVTASVVAVGGKAVKTTVKVGVKTVKVVAKVPDTIKRFGVSHTRGYKKAYRYSKRKMRLVKRNFKPKAVFQGGKKIAGNITKIAKTGFKMGSGIAGKASSTLQSALNSSDSTSGMAAGLAKSASAAVTGVKTGAKIAKTGVKVTAKVTRTIATKIERKIQTGTAKRTAKTVKKTAKAAKKSAETAIKVTAKIAKALSTALAKISSLLLSTAPWSLLIIGGIAIIFTGGFFMFGGSSISSVATKKQGFDILATDTSYSDEQIENMTDEQIEKIVNENTTKYSSNVQEAFNDCIVEPLNNTIDDFFSGSNNENSSNNEMNSNDVADSNSTVKKVVLNLNNTEYTFDDSEISTIKAKINSFKFNKFDFLAVLFTLTNRNSVLFFEETEKIDVTLNFSESEIREFMGDIDSNSCKFGQTYLYTNIDETDNKLSIELCTMSIHQKCSNAMFLYKFTENDYELYSIAQFLLENDKEGD